MKFITIDYSDLLNSDRWTPTYFLQESENLSSVFPMFPLSEVVKERKGTVDPQTLGDVLVSYLSLENVRSQTGELNNFKPKIAKEIKSRSKIFNENDVLYGRLRPELNKVYLCQNELTTGICSGEFLVLSPIKDQINPIYLRHILASCYVTNIVRKYRMGASLPRISINDLLKIEIPVPPLEIQNQISIQLMEVDLRIKMLRKELDSLPESQTSALVQSMINGSEILNI
ncbi:restriction endonuclease subunit S [Acinetobacter sp. YH16055]|uniref:restriction endonuclease subunit S n=1 Tax=Acinetobacter sp. YH16055 TaxID=2601193 RepID=UPI0015D157E5|nr:restriction endonuclease subunit S [Acinetobacter sp. YH16055]